jgi:hypothetical protein
MSQNLTILKPRLHAIVEDSDTGSRDILLTGSSEGLPAWVSLIDFPDEIQSRLQDAWAGNVVELHLDPREEGMGRVINGRIVDNTTLSLTPIDESPEAVQQLWKTSNDDEQITHLVADDDGSPLYEINLIGGSDEEVDQLWDDYLLGEETFEPWFDELTELDTPAQHIVAARCQRTPYIIVFGVPESTSLDVVHEIRSMVGEMEFP